MSVYGMAISSILQCYCLDEEKAEIQLIHQHLCEISWIRLKKIILQKRIKWMGTNKNNKNFDGF